MAYALAHRAGNGLVYANDFMDDDSARELLLKNVPERTPLIPAPLNLPRVSASNIGTRALPLVYLADLSSRWSQPVFILYRTESCGNC